MADRMTHPTPSHLVELAERPSAIMTADDFRYLGKLLDWAAGEGFCQIPGMIDPDEFAFDLWDRLGRDGAEYSADALADEIARAATEGRDG